MHIPHAAAAAVAIERLDSAIVFRGSDQDLLELGLVEHWMLPAAGETQRRGPHHPHRGGAWCVDALGDRRCYALKCCAASPAMNVVVTSWDCDRQHAAALRDDHARVIREYTQLGVNCLDLLETLLRQVSIQAGEATDLTTTVARLRQIYLSLEIRNTAHLGRAPAH
jgi:hypothetical protein